MLDVAILPPGYQLVEPGTPIGSGGTSVVHRVLYRDRLERALKIMEPRTDLEGVVPTERFVETFANEVANLARLSHASIAKITDFGFIEDGDDSRPYIATEFISGRSLGEFCQDPSISGIDVIAALRQVLDAIAYMHDHGVLHSDLKPENILVATERVGDVSHHTAKVVDLGAARHLASLDGDDELVYLYSTRRYVHPGLAFVVGNTTGNRIRRRDLRKFLPQHDMHSFGVLVSELLEVPLVKSKIGSDAGEATLFGLQELIRLVVGRRVTIAPIGARDFAARLDRTAHNSMSLLGVAELPSVPIGGIVIPATGRRVSLSKRAMEIVSHPFYQRLHHLPQLDLLPWVLPGATRTRFVHALHTYEQYTNAVRHLSRDVTFRLNVDVIDIERAILFALVSQLGHYHFLHMFEDFLSGPAARDSRVTGAGLMGDAGLMAKVIEGSVDGLSDLRDERGRTIQDLIESWGFDWASVDSLMRYPKDPVQAVLAALMDSPLDAEKLSYLQDDSLSTGLPFGRSVAGDPIFETLLVPSYDDWDRRKKGPVLGVREKSLSYLEHGVLARYWNIQTGYWNRTNRSLQAMVKFQIGELLKAERLNFGEYVSSTLHLSADGALRWINGRFSEEQAAGRIPVSENPVEPLLGSRRSIYKRLVTISGQSTIIGRESDGRVFESVRAISALEDRSVIETVERALTGVSADLEIQGGEILIDIPRPNREEKGGDVLVYTDDGRHYMDELFAVSTFLQKQRTAFEFHVKRMRVFISPRLHAKLADGEGLERAHEAVLEALRDEWSGNA